MTLQYSSLSNTPSVLNVSQPSGGIYSNTLFDPNTNSINIPTHKIQSIGGGRRRTRKNGRRIRRGGSRYRRSSRRHFEILRSRRRRKIEILRSLKDVAK